MKRAAAAALLCLAAACRTAGPAPPPSDASGWTRHVLATGTDGAPGYSVAVPPDLERRHVQGIDSQVAEFAAPGLRIGFDYGWYGGFERCRGRPQCREWEENIGGRQWQLTSYAPDVDVGGWVRRGLSAYVDLGGRMNLAINASCRDEASCARALAIVRTVEFAD